MPFDAFISYARSSTTDAAVAIKSGLESFAREWNRARSTHVFLDDASLSASAALGDVLTKSLGESRWLIVLLSEKAAASEWVDQEVGWWLENKGAGSLLLVHVDGHAAWRAGSGFTQDSTAVPSSLRSLTVEPRWVDLTWFNLQDSLRREDPRFVDVVLQLFCPIHGLDRGEAVALRDARVVRAKRLTRMAITTLASLLAVALASAGVAVVQMRTAQEQRDTATVRLLTSESQRILGENVGLARLLAAQANTMRSDATTRRTLFQSLAAGTTLVGEVYIAEPTGLASNAEGTRVFLGDASGTITEWDVTSRATKPIGHACGRVRDMVASADGAIVVGLCGDDGRGFVMTGGAVADLGPVSSITVSPSGATVAHLATADDETEVFTTHMTDGRATVQPAGTLPGVVTRIALRDDTTLSVLGIAPTEAAVYRLSPWREVNRVSYPAVAITHQRLLSRTGEAFYDSDDVWALSVARSTPRDRRVVDPTNAFRDFSTTALSPSGRVVAYGVAGGSIEVTSPAAVAANVKVLARLEAGDHIAALLVPNDSRVIAAHDGVVTAWDLTSQSPAVRHRSLAIETAPFTPVRPNHSGSLVALEEYDRTPLFDAEGSLVQELPGTVLAWRDDTSLFLALGAGQIALWSTIEQAVIAEWTAPTPEGVGRTAAWDGKAQELAYASDGRAYRLDPTTGSFRDLNLGDRELQAFSPDASQALTRSEDRYDLWDGSLTQHVHSFPAGSSPDFLANGDLIVYSPPGPPEWLSLSGEGRPALGSNHFDVMPVSPDGSLYLSSELPGAVRIIATSDRQELGRTAMNLFQDDTMGEFAMASFSGDSSKAFILSAPPLGQSGTTWTVIDLREQTLREGVCATVGRGLEASEWEALVGASAPTRLACQR